MITPDLSDDIKQFAADDEMQCKMEARQLFDEYFWSTTSSDYEKKFDKGCIEHGGFTAEKVASVDWLANMIEEFQDIFWYQSIRRFKLYKEGNLLPGEPYPPTR